MERIIIGISFYRNMFPENLVQACFQQVQTAPRDVSSRRLFSSRQFEWISYIHFRYLLKVDGKTPASAEPQLVYKDGTNVMGNMFRIIK